MKTGIGERRITLRKRALRALETPGSPRRSCRSASGMRRMADLVSLDAAEPLLNGLRYVHGMSAARQGRQ
jgi:hypothetical protein